MDQEHWIISDLNHGYNTSVGLQQEFTPKLDAIDSAEFSIGQGVTHPVYVYPGTVALNLREGGIDGRVLAASNPVFVPAYYSGNIVFRFPNAIPLVPGQVYALEPLAVGGPGGWIMDVNSPGVTPGYDGGRLLYNGQYRDDDLIFREGIGVPEPATWAVAVGRVACVVLNCRPNGFFRAMARSGPTLFLFMALRRRPGSRTG